MKFLLFASYGVPPTDSNAIKEVQDSVSVSLDFRYYDMMPHQSI
jgi:hypothetical protein